MLIAEDDYLWLPESVNAMKKALDLIPAHYVTAYDHPDRYNRANPAGKDIRHQYLEIHVTPDRHWRAVESTCMTFMSKAGNFKDDFEYFVRYHDGGGGFPNSRRLFRALQGLLPPSSPPRRLLFGPIPSLNTHVHLPYLAPLIDWESKARAIRTMLDATAAG